MTDFQVEILMGHHCWLYDSDIQFAVILSPSNNQCEFPVCLSSSYHVNNRQLVQLRFHM